MSKHRYQTKTSAGTDVIVLMGWDHVLRQFFLVVMRPESQTNTDSEDDGLLYSNLIDLAAFRREVRYFQRKLQEMDITVPYAMLQQISLDCYMNVVHRTVDYAADGSFVER